MFKEIASIPKKEIIPGFRGRFVHTEQSTLAYWEIDAGAELPEHAHHHEQTTQVLEGQFSFTLEGETRICEPGTIVVIPSYAKHSGKALTPCRLLDTFCPVREDYQ